MTQMSIFVFFVSAGVLFYGAFSLWVSLSKNYASRKVLSFFEEVHLYRKFRAVAKQKAKAV